MLAYYLVTVIHVIVCVILILVVLLQSGKGADLAGAFGGAGTQTAFGSRGPASFLSKLTTGAAILFMITCIGLSMIGTKREVTSILDSTKGAVAPVSKAPAPAKTQTQAPTPEQIKRIQQEIEAKQKQAQPSAPITPQGASSVPATAPTAVAPAKTPAKPGETKAPPREAKPPAGKKS
jgi:preprotein translocase subunit SecG